MSCPITDRFARAERAARFHDLIERLPLDELHPQPDAIVVLLGAEHLHHVRVADAREPAGLLQDPIVSHARGLAFLVEQLERDVPVEIGVERAIHLARHALTDPLEHDEAAPPRAARHAVRRRFVEGGNAAIERRDALDEPQMPDEPTLPWRDIGLDAGSSRPACRRRPRPPACRERLAQDSISISSASRTSARDTAIRAASALDLPCALAIC